MFHLYCNFYQLRKLENVPRPNLKLAYTSFILDRRSLVLLTTKLTYQIQDTRFWNFLLFLFSVNFILLSLNFTYIHETLYTLEEVSENM